MDYRSFLATATTTVLPYFGGTRVESSDRRWRVGAAAGIELAPGWWRWTTSGRSATPVEPAEPVALDRLPILRGHWCGDGWIAVDGRTVARAALSPDDEPAPFSRAVLRKWHSGDWLLDALDFDDEPEARARLALEQRTPLGDVPNATPSLRSAFGIALGLAVARDLEIHVDPREIRAFAVEIAAGGPAVVQHLFDELIAARAAAIETARLAAFAANQAVRVQAAVRSARDVTRTRGRAEDRADDALAAAGARMLACRTLERGARLDVTYTVDGTRVISLVDADSLQVLDPGVCLSGAHRVLTLGAMPSVIREAIEDEVLNITRWS